MHLAACLVAVALAAAGVAGQTKELKIPVYIGGGMSKESLMQLTSINTSMETNITTGNDTNETRRCFMQDIVEEMKNVDRSLIKIIDGLNMAGSRCEMESENVNSLTKEMKQLKAELSETKKDVSSNRNELSANKASIDKVKQDLNKQVYFSAGISSSNAKAKTVRTGDHSQRVVTYSFGENLVFDKVITNVGNAYNASGFFTAPFAGYYEFTVSLVTPYGDQDDACAYLRKKGTNVAQVLTENTAGTYQGTTIEVVLKLEEGDTVDVVANTNIVGNQGKPIKILALGTPASWFSGRLLALSA